jgi:hypothetical protein
VRITRKYRILKKSYGREEKFPIAEIGQCNTNWEEDNRDFDTILAAYT